MTASSFVQIRRMPTGRYRFSLQQMRTRAAAEGLTDVVSRLDRALAAAERTQRLELGYLRAQNNTSTARGSAALIDNMIDEQIVAIHKTVDAHRIGDDDDPVVQAAREMMTEFFPDGVRAITHRSFEEQLSIMDTMMEAFESDFATHVDTLHLGRQITRLGRLIEEFRVELKLDKAEAVSFDQVRASRDDLHDQVCRAVVSVLFALDDDGDPNADRKQQQILAPLYFQQERVAEARRRNRVPTDVDPDTGEEVLAEAEEPADLVEPEPAPAPF